MDVLSSLVRLGRVMSVVSMFASAFALVGVGVGAGVRLVGDVALSTGDGRIGPSPVTDVVTMRIPFVGSVMVMIGISVVVSGAVLSIMVGSHVTMIQYPLLGSVIGHRGAY